MVGEFLSAEVCRKDSGENCSAEAVVDGMCSREREMCVRGLLRPHRRLSLPSSRGEASHSSTEP